MVRLSARSLFLSLLIIFTLPALVHPANLNAPAEKRVTIGSEIYRGSSAIDNASSKVHATDILAVLQAYDNVFSLNRQSNMDTDAFILGASFMAWADLDIILRLASQNKNPLIYPPREVELARNAAKLYFNDVRKYQKKLNIDDRSLIEACHMNYKALETKILNWEHQAH